MTIHDAATVQLYADRLNQKELAVLMGAASGVSYTTMAETLSIPVGTVRSRLHRARVLLEKMIAAKAGAVDGGP